MSALCYYVYLRGIDMESEIMRTFEFTDEVVEKIRIMGFRLLKDAGYIDSDDEAHM